MSLFETLGLGNKQEIDMKVIRTGLFSVLKRFPEHKDNAKRLFRESESFQTMCEDYRKCVKALDHWNRSEIDIAPLRRTEYTTLMQELEEEIVMKLTELNLPISK
jgi:hypothetical protein